MSGFDRRKAEILGGLTREAAAAAARRRASRRVAGGVGAAALIGVVAVTALPRGGTVSVPGPGPVAEVGAPARPVRVDVAAYAITDEELVAALEETGEAFTLMWVNGEARLVKPASGGEI